MSDPFAYASGSDDTIRRPLPVEPMRPASGFGDASRPRNLFEPAAQQTSRARLDDDFFEPRQTGKRAEFRDDFDLSPSPVHTSRRSGDAAIDKAFDLAAVNPLVSAASPLLWLAGRLNESDPPEDIAEFRSRVMDEIRHFETSAMARDVPDRLVRISRYALCAIIDDIILNTRWGAVSGWTSSSLVGLLYNETWGGERFYDLLAQLQRQPEQNIDALELMAICLAIGFAGKYRVMEGGQGQLTRLRHDLYRTIRRVRGPYERNLSVTWKALPAPHQPPVNMLLPWIAVLLLLLLLAGLWAVSSISLRSSVERAAEQIRALVPAIPVIVERAGIPDIPKPVPPVRVTQIERMSTVLAPEIATARVEVVASGANVVVRMLDVSFPSGGLDLAASEEPLLARIAAALDPEQGPVLVIGHTDNVPVGPGSQLGDNLTISVARARSTAQMLQRHIKDPARVSFEGRGESDPIASNTEPEGRARNRRVEFQIPAEVTE